jgi:ABC-type nitrate/sulfonate/bicarbonate transport system ATPase subunit
MRQRAAFLRTYLLGTDVMLLDEPFSALDAITRKDLRQWFSKTSRDLGIASLMITHDVDEAVAMARRIYVLGGKPSHIVGEVAVERPSNPKETDFELTGAFIATKREVLSLLN